MSATKPSAKSNHRIFDSLNVYAPEEYKKTLNTDFQTGTASIFGSGNKKNQASFPEIDSKHYNYLKTQNQEIFSSKNHCAILESEIAKLKKVQIAEIAKYKENISEMEKNLILSNSENDRVCNTLITLNAELQHWKKEYQTLDGKLLQVSLENDKLTRLNKQSSEELERWKEKNSSEENDLQANYKEMESMQEKISTHNQVLEGFQRELDLRNENNVKLQSLCMRLRKERDELFEKNERLENLIQASTEDLEEMKANAGKINLETEKKLEELKEEESKMMLELNLKYQDLYNKKLSLDENYKQIALQNKELNQRNLISEAIIQEKNRIIMEFELKINSHDGELENLIQELAVKDQTIYRLKTEKIKPISKLESKLNITQNQIANKTMGILADDSIRLELQDNLQKISLKLEEEKRERQKLEEKNSHLVKTMLLCYAENDRLHGIIRSFRA